MSETEAGSVIGPDLTVKGELFSEGSLSVHGKIEGSINAANVSVERGGSVKGDISAARVRIAGEVDGSVAAKSVDITEGAHVLADIEHELLSVQAGASLLGQVKRAAVERPSPRKESPDFPTPAPPNAAGERPLSRPVLHSGDQSPASTGGEGVGKPETADG